MIHRTSVGLDVHARSIRGAAFVPETGEVIERGFGYDPAAVAGWVRSLPQPAWCVYESGPTGFDLQRGLAVAGVECVAGAVSKMPRPSGDGVKADRRDAVFLARMLAVGNVVEARVPTRATGSGIRSRRGRRGGPGEPDGRPRHRVGHLGVRRGRRRPARDGAAGAVQDRGEAGPAGGDRELRHARGPREAGKPRRKVLPDLVARMFRDLARMGA